MRKAAAVDVSTNGTKRHVTSAVEESGGALALLPGYHIPTRKQLYVSLPTPLLETLKCQRPRLQITVLQGCLAREATETREKVT